MNYYRLYLLSAPGGRFVGFDEIEADADIEALQRAAGLAGDRPFELWCGPRKVGPVTAAVRAASPAPQL